MGSDKPLGIGLVGFGNIGSGVLRTLAENRATIARRLPRGIEVVRIADLDTTTPRNAPYDPAILSADAKGLIVAPEVDVVIELIGGVEPARTFVAGALERGKHVVTANKAMLAVHGAELAALARRKGVALLFEASVGGGIPIVRALQQGLCANEFRSIQGIINGTCNYILTQMEERGIPFGQALSEAQAAGYAEPDPTYDIQGHDTAHKIAILASLAFGMDIRFEDVWREGIAEIQPIDLKLARELGYAVKLLGIAKRDGADAPAEVRVHPTLVPAGSLLAGTGGVFNAILVEGTPIGKTVYVGRGAGADATSSAIVGDLMAIAAQPGEFNVAVDARLAPEPGSKNIRPIEDLQTHYYLRFALADRPGVMATLAGKLADHGVGIESMIQHRSGEANAGDGVATLTIVTHLSREGNVRRLLAEVSGMEIVRGAPFVLRVEE